jgi:nitroreductase
MAAGFDPRTTPWRVRPEDFPRHGRDAEKLCFLLRYAVLAPSSHNVQPWAFRLREGGVVVLLDRERRLPVADPDGRELTLSVGAAVQNLRLAAARFGYFCHVHPLPDPSQADVLADVTLREGGPADAVPVELFDAIVRRRTHRFEHDHRPLAPADRARLVELIGEASRAVRILEPVLHGEIAALVAEGDRTLFADAAFRRELSFWMRPNGGADGIPVDAVLAVPGALARLAPWLMRTFARGHRVGRADARAAERASALAVVSSDESAPGWLEAGEHLQRLLLAATAAGLQSSFFNQPLQVPDLRRRLRELLDAESWPQAVVRLGYAAPLPRASPRRPIEDVLRG